jgi:hypothetical protein
LHLELWLSANQKAPLASVTFFLFRRFLRVSFNTNDCCVPHFLLRHLALMGILRQQFPKSRLPVIPFPQPPDSNAAIRQAAHRLFAEFAADAAFVVSAAGVVEHANHGAQSLLAGGNGGLGGFRLARRNADGCACREW